MKRRVRSSNGNSKNCKATFTRLPNLDPAIFENDRQRVALSAVLAPLYRSQIRRQMQKLHPASEDKMDAELLTMQANLRIQQSVDAYLRQELPGLLAHIFSSAWKGKGWACKLILELTGIAEQLRLLAGRGQEGHQQSEALSEIEKTLVASFRQLVAGEGRKEAQSDVISE